MSGDKRSVMMRADVSRGIGMGHVMRCLALAQEFRKRDVGAVIILKVYDGIVLNQVKDYGFAIEVLDKGLRVEQEADYLGALAERYNSRLLVTDLSYHRKLTEHADFIRLLKMLKEKGLFIVTIDGGMAEDCLSLRQDIPADLIVMPYFGSERVDYCISDKSKLLLGPAYFIFREEFVRASKDKTEPKRGSACIAITMGGSDPYRLTERTVSALLRLNEAMHVKIILGAGFLRSREQRLTKLIHGRSSQFQILKSVDNMAEILKETDIAIVSNGLTKYETMLLGIPTIVLNYSAARMLGGKGLRGTKLFYALADEEDISPEDIIKVVRRLLRGRSSRRPFAPNSRSRIDGNGASRIFSSIPREYVYAS